MVCITVLSSWLDNLPFLQEYLHFYCDPPLCHRDIKSSNILLDENFVAKVRLHSIASTITLTFQFIHLLRKIDLWVFAMQLADFGLAHASRDGSICFEPVNTDIRGTPGQDQRKQLLLKH